MSAFASIVTLRELVWEPSLHDILKIVCRVCKQAERDLLSSRRWLAYFRARAIYYVVAREATTKTWKQIGRHCGDRDHSTVLNGFQKVQASPEAFEPELSLVRRLVNNLENPRNPLGPECENVAQMLT